MTAPLPPTLADTSPATKLVYRELERADGPLSPDALVERTGLARRTIRRVTTTLVEAGSAEQVHPSAQTVAYRTTAGQTDRSHGD